MRKRGKKLITKEDLRQSDQDKEDVRRRLSRIEAEMRVFLPALKLRKRGNGG